MDGFSQFPEGDRNLAPVDLSSYLAFMSVDPFTEHPFNSFFPDHFFAQFNHLAEQRILQMHDEPSDAVAVDVHLGVENLSATKTTALKPEGLPDSVETDDADVDMPSYSCPLANGSSIVEVKDSVPQWTVGDFLAEKLLKALSLLKKSSGTGILVQVWMPSWQGDKYILSTSQQPYLLDEILAGYREISRTYNFSGNEEHGSVLGLPGRVFVSGVPEWTSNILYYSRLEYVRMDHALGYEVRGSLALPIFSPDDDSCRAVLELVTKKEKPDFDLETENVCKALQAVNLRCVKVHAQGKNIKLSQRSALAEILDVLRVACHAHMLPLALTWIPFVSVGGLKSDLDQETETMLHLYEAACYVNDRRMQGFLHACSENPLHKGQGIAGRALESDHPVFFSDIKEFDVHQYPVAHHARKFGLHAAVAIRLRSTHTGNDDYVLEFFLPMNCRGSAEQQLLLNNLSTTLNRICKSLRTVSYTEALGSDASRMGIKHRFGASSNQADLSIEQATDLQVEQCDSAFQHQEMESDKQADSASLEQAKSNSFKCRGKMGSLEEKSISLGVLQQYYSGTLRDAAKSIGVCPTTLKKICRQNGISRWPSRKINKVNHSVQKIQKAIDSVPGVIGKLKYDHASGKLITEASSSSLCELPLSGEQFAEPFGSSKLPTGIRTENCDPSTNLHHEKDRLHVLPMDSIQVDTYTSNQKQTASNGFIVYGSPCSKITDSSSGGASSDSNPKGTRKMSVSPADGGFMIRVKATYNEDTVRFKFFSSMNISILLEEIAKRFKLPIGVFQLKYKDDEDEWVILENDSDMQECIEMLESTESRCMRLMVRDIPSAIGSSSSSNNLLALS